MSEHFLVVLDNILDPEECSYFIDMIDTNEKLETIDRPSFAVYDRMIYKNKEFADKLFSRIRSAIPETYDGKRIVGLNDHIRLSKYEPGGKFNVHKDGFNQDSQGNRSIMTVNVFLNKNFNGGETDFLLDDKETLRFRAVPEIGRGAIFYSQQYHRGNEVLDGKKYLFRTDVMVSDF
jgi:hypothetical protein